MAAMMQSEPVMRPGLVEEEKEPQMEAEQALEFQDALQHGNNAGLKIMQRQKKKANYAGSSNIAQVLGHDHQQLAAINHHNQEESSSLFMLGAQDHSASITKQNR